MKKNVIFYSPHFGENTLTFVSCVMKYPDVNVIGLGQDSWDYINELHRFRGFFHEYYKVDNATDQDQLEKVITEILAERPIHRILNVQEQLQMLISRIRQKYNITGLHLDNVKPFRDKDLMKRRFREYHITCAQSQRVEKWEDAVGFIKKVDYPVIIKPIKGAGSENTLLVKNDQGLDESYKLLNPSEGNPAIIEEYIEGIEGSFDCINIDGKPVFYSITTYHPSPLDAMLNAWIQPIYMFSKDQDAPEFDDVRKTGFRVLEALNSGSNMTHMEWFRRNKDGKVYAAEIAARPPGPPIPALHNYGHDIDLFDAWCKLMIYNQFDYHMIRKHHVGCACLRAQGEGNIRHIEGLEQIRRELGGLIIEEQIPALGTPKTEAYIGEASVYCRGQNYKQVLDALKFVVNTVRMYC